MKKAVLQKRIKESLEARGFHKLSDGVYYIDCGDSVTRLLLRLPDLTHGFIIAAQFRDFGPFTGKFSDSLMRQYDYENTLGFASKYEYSDKDIIEAVEKVISGLSCYIETGKYAIKDRINEWTFGDFNEKIRNDVLVYMGLDGINPYSLEYLTEKVNDLKRGGVIILSLNEYQQHKDFYDEYNRYHCKLDIDLDDQIVRITYHLSVSKN